MKKHILYAGMLLTMIGFSACNEDYKDWADPQSNPQDGSKDQTTAVYKAGKDANIVMGDAATTDSVEIATLDSFNAEEGSTVVFNGITINSDYTLPYTITGGNTIKVSTAQLDSVTQEAYKSRASIARELTIDVNATAVTPLGEGIQLIGNSVAIALQPEATPALDPAGYYIVGDFFGWDGASAVPMVADANNPNMFVLETEIPADMSLNFKIIPGSAISGSTIDWDKALGSSVDGDDTGNNFVVWSNPQAISAIQTGKVIITFDALNYRFTVKDNSAPTELFMTGSAYSWGGTWKELTPVNSTKGSFWAIIYFGADEQVKFAPQAGWGNDFGFTDVTISQESIDLAGLTDAGGNLQVGIAGWYLVYVSVIGDDKTIAFEKPNIYLMGDTSYDGWNSQLIEQDLFTIPEISDGEFISPAFLANGAVRICVHPTILSTDWWKTEFIVLNGEIAYRGNGDDQTAVNGTIGQMVYLNFTDGTGRIE